MPDIKFVLVPQGKHYFKVNCSDIIYLEADGSYCKIITDSKSYQMSTNIKKLAEMLDPDRFFRISRKHVINLDHLQCVNNDQITVSGVELPITRVAKKELVQRFHILNKEM